MPPSVTPIEPSRSHTMRKPCAAPATRPTASASSKPEPRIAAAGEHRDTACRAEHADDRQIEFAHHHRETKPQRDEADIAERLERRERCGDAEETAPPGIEHGEQHDGEHQYNDWPRMGVPQQRRNADCDLAHCLIPPAARLQRHHRKHDHAGDEKLPFLPESPQQQHGFDDGDDERADKRAQAPTPRRP